MLTDNSPPSEADPVLGLCELRGPVGLFATAALQQVSILAPSGSCRGCGAGWSRLAVTDRLVAPSAGETTSGAPAARPTLDSDRPTLLEGLSCRQVRTDPLPPLSPPLTTTNPSTTAYPGPARLSPIGPARLRLMSRPASAPRP
jgi:hypothetical protein